MPNKAYANIPNFIIGVETLHRRADLQPIGVPRDEAQLLVDAMIKEYCSTRWSYPAHLAMAGATEPVGICPSGSVERSIAAYFATLDSHRAHASTT